MKHVITKKYVVNFYKCTVMTKNVNLQATLKQSYEYVSGPTIS